VLSTLGAAYAETGDFESAKKWSQQAVDISKKAVDAAKDDKERAKLQHDLEQLQKERASYDENKPVRERQSMEEAPANEEKKADEAKEDQLTPSDAKDAESDSTAVF
jgi:hypothetical protein